MNHINIRVIQKQRSLDLKFDWLGQKRKLTEIRDLSTTAVQHRLVRIYIWNEIDFETYFSLIPDL